MLIREMTEDECGTALEQVGFGRLACVRGGQPYIVPIYFSYDRKHLYGVTTLGKKNRVDAVQSARLSGD